MNHDEVFFSSYDPSDLDDILRSENKRLDGWTSQQVLEQLQKNVDNFVLKLNRQCVAYAMFQSVLDQSDLLLVVVDEHYRRRGLAEQLLRSAIEVLQKKQIVTFYLDVRESNSAAIGLYKKLGFEINGRRKNYYSNTTNHSALTFEAGVSGVDCSQEDALLMSYLT